MSEAMQKPSSIRPVIYSVAVIYLLAAIVWTVLIGQYTHELLREHGTRDRYDEITKVVRAQRTAKAIIEVCVEGRRLEIDDPNGYAFDIPV
jgi:uncharacterized membrane protein